MSAVIRLALGGLVAVTTIGAYTAARVIQQGNREEARPADAIVVLGPRSTTDGRRRCSRRGWTTRSRSTSRGSRRYWSSPAASRRATAPPKPPWRASTLARKVPASAIVGEDQGRTTLESLEAVAKLLRERGATRGVRVGPDAHAARPADGEGPRDPGVRVAHDDLAHRAGRRAAAWAIVHELGALAAYFVTGGMPFRDPPRASVAALRRRTATPGCSVRDFTPRTGRSAWRAWPPLLYSRCPCAARDARRPTTSPSAAPRDRPARPVRSRASSERGSREAGRGSHVRRSHRLRT